MSDGADTTTQEGAAPGTAAPETAGQQPDIDAMMLNRFSEFENRLNGALDQRFAALAPPEEEEDPYAQLGEMYDDPQAAQQARQLLEQINQGVIAQATAPLMQQIQQLQQGFSQLNNELDAGDLEAQFPELQQPEVRDQVRAAALQMATELGDPSKATNARLLRAAYMELKAMSAAAGETPASGAVTTLENAGGAAPGEPEQDIAKQIVAANGPMTPQRRAWGW